MLCLVGVEEAARTGLWRRIKSAFRGDRGFDVCDDVVLGVRMLRVTLLTESGMKPEEVRRRIKSAAEQMRRERVSHVVFAKNFPYKAFVLREGFDEMDGTLLTEALAGRIAAHFGGAGKYAALFTGRLTVVALRVLIELCASFKYLMVTTERGGGHEFDVLRRRAGVSVIEQPTERQLSHADIAVFFGPPKRLVALPDNCVAIGVGRGALDGVIYNRAVSGLTLGLAGDITDGLPPDFPHDVLYSVALGAGTLKPDDIVLRDIQLDDSPRRSAHS